MLKNTKLLSKGLIFERIVVTIQTIVYKVKKKIEHLYKGLIFVTILNYFS